jgi:hypothetical protein
MQEGPHLEVLLEALRTEAEAQRLLQAGDPGAGPAFAQAAARYRESWELAPPRSFGRLIGMLKASLLAGEGEDAARYAIEQLGGEADSPPSAYALAIAALTLREDDRAATAARARGEGGPAFARAAAAIAAIAAGDEPAYRTAVEAIVEDFCGRDEHLTGVPIADTALMLDRLAESRGMRAGVPALLPTG